MDPEQLQRLIHPKTLNAKQEEWLRLMSGSIMCRILKCDVCVTKASYLLLWPNFIRYHCTLPVLLVTLNVENGELSPAPAPSKRPTTQLLVA